MTQYQAKQALNQGHGITHKFFSKGEFISRSPENGQLIDEKHIPINETLFWEVRQDEKWQDGWETVGWCLVNLDESPIPAEEKVTFEGTYQECFEKYIDGKHTIVHRSELYYLN